MRIELFVAVIITTTLLVILPVAHAQLLQYIDHESNNLTELCNQYLTGVTTAEGLIRCVPYYNDTIKERLGVMDP